MFSRVKKAENHTHNDSQFMSSLGNFVTYRYSASVYNSIPEPMLSTYICETRVGGQLEYSAGVSIDYNSSEFSIMMKRGEDGRVKFVKPNSYEYGNLATQIPITHEGAYTALSAVQKYIKDNLGKKYGSFFGLCRNGNSFVRYVLKHTHDADVKSIAKLHSPLTERSAAKKIDKFNLSKEAKAFKQSIDDEPLLFDNKDYSNMTPPGSF